MPQHGFAATSTFVLMDVSSHRAQFRLTAIPETRQALPFTFVRDITYARTENTLAIAAEISNPGAIDLPASFGFHPAFRWPLYPGRTKSEHVVIFPDDDVLDIAQLQDRLVPDTRTRHELQTTASNATTDCWRAAQRSFSTEGAGRCATAPTTPLSHSAWTPRICFVSAYG